MNTWTNFPAFVSESIWRNLDMFLRWKNMVLQILDTLQILVLQILDYRWRKTMFLIKGYFYFVYLRDKDLKKNNSNEKLMNGWSKIIRKINEFGGTRVTLQGQRDRPLPVDPWMTSDPCCGLSLSHRACVGVDGETSRACQTFCQKFVMTRKVKANPRVETVIYFIFRLQFMSFPWYCLKKKRYKLPPKWLKEIKSSSDFNEFV